MKKKYPEKLRLTFKEQVVDQVLQPDGNWRQTLGEHPLGFAVVYKPGTQAYEKQRYNQDSWAYGIHDLIEGRIWHTGGRWRWQGGVLVNEDKPAADNLDQKPKAARVQVGEHMVRVTSLRLRVFAQKGTRCYLCAKQATHFSIDKFNWDLDRSPHMNLWVVDDDGSELLFTHDHIIDRAKGGDDAMHNAETCCAKCNNLKNMNKISMIKKG